PTPPPAFFLLNASSPTALFTLSLHDALPIFAVLERLDAGRRVGHDFEDHAVQVRVPLVEVVPVGIERQVVRALPTGTTSTRGTRDRKSTRLNSSHVAISYAVFCLKKKIRHLE